MTETTSTTPVTRSDRPQRCQFSVGTVLVSTALVAFCLGLAAQFGWPFGLFAFYIFFAVVVTICSRDRMVVGGVFCFIGVGAAVSLIAILSGQSLGHRGTCHVNLKQVSTALVAYAQEHGSFPPAFTVDDDGRPLHSWRTLILPYLDRGGLYSRIHLDEPWDSPYNSRFHNQLMDFYCCPAQRGDDAKSQDRTQSCYFAVVGPNTVWPEGDVVRWIDVADRKSHTILVVEVADSGIHWMEPRDLHVVQMARGINATSGQGISSHHVEGALVGFADTSVDFLLNETDPKVIDAMLKIHGSEQAR